MTVSFLTLCIGVACSGVTQHEVGAPDLPASRCCFNFRASFQVDYAAAPNIVDSEWKSEWKIDGACFGSRWHMNIQRPHARATDIACDGERVFVRAGSSVFIQPLSQGAVPMELWSVAPLLQLGSELYGDSAKVGGSRWTSLAGGGRVVRSETLGNTCEYAYEWRLGDGTLLDRIAHSIETIDGKPFLRGTMEECFRGKSGAEVHLFCKSEMKVEGVLDIGGAFLGKSLTARGWGPGPNGGVGDLPLRSTMVGTIESCAVLDVTEFDNRLAARTTPALGTHIIDRTRPAVFDFTTGERGCKFDGVRYQLASALLSPPTDLELMELLRDAKLEDDASEPSAAIIPPSPTAADPSAPHAARARLERASVGLRVEPANAVNLGVVRFAQTPTTAQAVFSIHNTSDRARKIKSVKASCGCTSTSADRSTIAPGQAARITTTLTVERAKTYHSAIWVEFEDGQVEELQIVAVGVPEKAIRATAMKSDHRGDVMTIVLFTESGIPEGDVGVPKAAEELIASDSGWLPVGGEPLRAKHWIRDIVKRPTP